MLTPDEEKFMTWWENNREKEKSPLKQLSLGLGLGILMGVGILINLISGWYTRANMVANSQSTPIVLLFGIVAIAGFFSFFYKRHKWEMNDQRYRELLNKKEKTL